MSSYLVRIEFPSGLAMNQRVDGNTKLTENFKVYEYANTKGKTTIPQLVLNDRTWQLYICFQEFREWYYKQYGNGITVTSNYRQIDFNRRAGGSTNSLHLKGLAIDFKLCSTAKSDEQRKLIENKWKLITMSHGIIAGCNWYTNGMHFSVYETILGNKSFTHRDYRGTSSDW